MNILPNMTHEENADLLIQQLAHIPTNGTTNSANDDDYHLDERDDYDLNGHLFKVQLEEKHL